MSSHNSEDEARVEAYGGQYWVMNPPELRTRSVTKTNNKLDTPLASSESKERMSFKTALTWELYKLQFDLL